jgi:hypothetical protein
MQSVFYPYLGRICWLGWTELMKALNFVKRSLLSATFEKRRLFRKAMGVRMGRDVSFMWNAMENKAYTYVLRFFWIWLKVEMNWHERISL